MIDEITAAPLPFDVPIHDRMAVRVPGKLPNTVVTLEQMAFTWRICEYTERISYDRFWCYSDNWAAALALGAWMLDEQATEPTGWVKATDKADGNYRVRRGRVSESGEWIVTEEIPE